MQRALQSVPVHVQLLRAPTLLESDSEHHGIGPSFLDALRAIAQAYPGSVRAMAPAPPSWPHTILPARRAITSEVVLAKLGERYWGTTTRDTIRHPVDCLTANSDSTFAFRSFDTGQRIDVVSCCRI